jgi:transcriptional regulator with XRE-family HTH domain
MNQSVQFGNILKALRERHKLTVEKLANQSGISIPTINKVEAGNTQIRMSNLYKAYRDLCKSEQEWLRLCVQWLVAHPEVGGSTIHLEDHLSNVVRDGAAHSQRTMEDMAYVCGDKSPSEIKLLKRVAAHLRHRPFATMVKGYLDAVEPTAV